MLIPQNIHPRSHDFPHINISEFDNSFQDFFLLGNSMLSQIKGIDKSSMEMILALV